MTILDPYLLQKFRETLQCEWCKARGAVDPHHYWYRRGTGGGSRIDHRFNLVALCRYCHTAHHQGQWPLRIDLLAIVSAREAVTQDYIIATLLAIRNAPRRGIQ